MKRFSNGGSTMFKTTTFGCLCALFLVACGPNEVYVDGTMPVEVDGSVAILECLGAGDCFENSDCTDTDRICLPLEDVSVKCGFAVAKCVIGCDAKFETVTVTNEDGTSKEEVVKVAGTDTCQRTGDLTKFCDVTGNRLCKAYEEPEQPVKPDEPKPTPTAEMTQLKCCYFVADNGLVGLYGQMAYSTATVAEPEAWKAARDMQIGTDGCFVAEVDLTTVTKGFWVDLTVGPAEGKAAEDVVWLGSSMKPTKCFIGEGEAEATIGSFEQNYGWPFGDATL